MSKIFFKTPFSSSIGLCQVTSHSRESKCILGIAAICKVSKLRCSVVGELSFSFSLKWYVLVLKSAIEKFRKGDRKGRKITKKKDILGLTLEKKTRQ